MKKILLILLLIILFNEFSISQFSLKSVSPYFDYSVSLNKDSVNSASGIGGGVELNFGITQNFSISLNGSYSVISIDQNNPVQRWGWAYWDKRFASRVSILRTDTNYIIDITPTQFINVMPIILSLNYSFEAIENLNIIVSGGAGIFLFERNLYQTERWRKKFPTINYVYEYEYRDYADEKRGDLFGYVGSFGADYKIYEWINLYFKAKFSYIPKQSRTGYDSFPINNILSTNFGISIFY